VRRGVAVAAGLAALVVAPAAPAADPGRWREVASTTIPIVYYQGMTAAPGGAAIFFDGIYTGRYRTDRNLRETARTADVIPADVMVLEGYNHIGDISWDGRDGGRVLLPVECYYPGQGGGANTCRTGSFGVADPRTLSWRYYVKLDPRDIPKAMWVERSPDGRLLWTSVGNDLIAYRAGNVRRANAAPTGPLLRPVRRLRGAVPPTGVTGAAFYDGRLLLAGQDGRRFEVWSVDTRGGARRLEIERRLSGESEGLATLGLRGGVLHWMIQPVSSTGPPTYPRSTLLSFFPARPPLGIAVRPRIIRVGRPTRVVVRVRARILGRRRPAAGAVVRLLGARTRADRRGRAVLRVRARRPGALRLRARWRGGAAGAAVVAVRAGGLG
jgi:hypothetical protein